MTAFAAGDALGVPWELSAPGDIDADRIAELPAPARDWPRGSTSDDTAQMLLVAELITDTAGNPSPGEFLSRLAAAAPEIRGIGSTTRRSLELFRDTGRVPEPSPRERPTNGAAMRMLPVGLAVPTSDPDLRRTLVESLSIGTHRAPDAIAAACLVAAMASWAIEGTSMTTVLAAAEREAAWVTERYGPPTAVNAALAGTWTPPAAGISLHALETIAAVVHILRTAPTLDSALRESVQLGGDTDTVAALVGGIRGAMAPEELDDLSWLPLVDFERPTESAIRLHDLRASWYR